MSATVQANLSAGAPSENRSRRARHIQAKHVFFIFYGAMTLFVLYRYEAPFLDSQSPAWTHFAKVTWWLLPHGLAGALALFIGPLQFSNRLRQRRLGLHRILGRLYVVSVFVASPISVVIAIKQGPPSILMAAVMQSSAWVLTTATALYCIRHGNIQQHRQWMIRSYPFAMVFVFTRVLLAIPAIERMGELGLIWVVWTCVAAACFIPSFVINWRAIRSQAPRQAAPEVTNWTPVL
jgi:uncharacterized membrane protein